MTLRCALLAAVALCAPAARADSELTRQFAKQADLDVASDGLAMLVLPPAVMAETRPDLADLRITDREGREVAFSVHTTRPRADLRTPLRAVVREVERSPLQPADAEPLVRERYVLAPIETLLAAQAKPFEPGESWELVLDTLSPSFVRTATVEARGADGSLTALVARAPLFRVDGAERTRIPLPAHRGELVVTIEGSERGYVGGAVFRFVPLGVAQPSGAALVSLREVGRASSGGKTLLTLARPLGLVPDALRIESDEPAFARRVRVFEHRPGGEVFALGEGAIARVGSAPELTAFDVPLAAGANARELAIEIDDRDSPPLASLRVSALVRQPTLVFALRDHGDAQPDGTLHFGGAQALRPVYDLASLAELFPYPAELERSLAGIDPHGATLGATRTNPAFAPSPALDFAMQPGAPLEVRAFSARRGLAVPQTANGLSRYRLAPEDVAAARPDLADVRVADANGVQWPLLLAPDAAREWREAPITSLDADARTSRFALSLPATGVRVAAIELETSAPFFSRSHRVVARSPGGDEIVLAAGQLVRSPERALPVRIALPGDRIESLELRIENGDDAPLPIARASVSVVLPELFLTATPGDYWLLMGDADATPPQYELERVRELVLAVPSEPIRAGALEPNPVFSSARDFASGVRGRTLAVWLVLGGAVALLAALTLRAAQREEPPPPTS